MSGFTPVFGGGAVNPAELSYVALSFNTSQTLAWPSLSQSATNTVAALIEATPGAGSLTLTMPDARQATVGQQVVFRNMTGTSFDVLANDGSALATIAGNKAWFIYLTDNSTAAGTWGLVQLGTGTSSADATSLAGLGLTAISTKLNSNMPLSLESSDRSVTSADRAKCIFAVASMTLTLPTTVSAGNGFFFSVHASPAATLSIVCSGGNTIDGTPNISLAPNESAFIISGSVGLWGTIGRGRSTVFNFTQLIKDVSGNTDVTLASAECGNKVIQFIGALTGNINVIFPSVVGVYYTYNNTTGSYSLTAKTAAGGGVSLQQGYHNVLTCDGTDVFRSFDAVIDGSFGDGSAAAPSIYHLGDTNTGMYFPAADKVGITAGGTKYLEVDGTAGKTNFSGNGIGNLPNVTTKGDILAASAASTVTRVGVGSTNGAALIADSSQTAGLNYTPEASPTFPVNYLFNPTMEINQRGALSTSVAVTTNTYGIDMWYGKGKAAAGVLQMSRLAAASWAPASSPVPCHYSLDTLITTADAAPALNSNYCIGQTIEDRVFSQLMDATAKMSRNMTLSFYAYCSTAGTYGGVVGDASGTSNWTCPFTFTITSPNVWQRFAVVIPYKSFAVDVVGAAGFYVRFSIGTNASNKATALTWTNTANIFGATGQADPIQTFNLHLNITGTRLEVGDYASAFNPLPFTERVRQCKRYHLNTFEYGTAEQQNLGGTPSALAYRSALAAVNSHSVLWQFPVEMAASPNLIYYNPAAANAKWRNSTAGADSGTPSADFVTSKMACITNPQVGGDAATNLFVIHASADCSL